MTNAEIIMRESLELAEQGILATTESTFTDENGEEVTLEVPEDIHTFDQWKKQGRIVKYGEHAIAKFAVWSPTKASQKVLDETDDELTDKEKKQLKMYMRTACFFKKSQTQTAEEAEKDRKARQDAKKKTEAKPEQPEPKKADTKKDVKKSEMKSTKAKKSTPKKSAPKAEAKKTATKSTKSEKPKKSADKELVTLRNAFEKATLKKNPSRYLLIERNGNDVYLCDSGWYVAKVSQKDYERVFTEKSCLKFPPVSDGMCRKVENVDRGNSYDKHIVEEAYENQFGLKDKIKSPVEVLEYKQTLSNGKVAHAIKCEGMIKAVDDDFLKAFPKDTEWFSTNEMVTPIVSKNGAILPIRIDDDFTKNAK